MLRQFGGARVVISLVAMLALVLAACGSPDPTPTPVPPPTPTAVPTIEPEVEDEEEADEPEAGATPEPVEEPTATAEPEEEPAETPEPAEEPAATPEPEEEPVATPEPAEEAGDEAMEDMAQLLAAITLPDGTICLHASRGATLAFDEKRVNYTCNGNDEEERVLLGDMSTRLDLLTVELGVLVREDDAWALESSEEMEMRMAEVTLGDGVVCLNAGQGATLALDDARVNFSCAVEDAEGDVVLLGDMEIDMDVLTATRGLVVEGDDGFELAESETVYIIAVVGAEVD